MSDKAIGWLIEVVILSQYCPYRRMNDSGLASCDNSIRAIGCNKGECPNVLELEGGELTKKSE